MSSPFKQASEQGYSPEEVLSYLNNSPEYAPKIEEARKQGYSDSEIQDFLAQQGNPREASSADSQAQEETSPEQMRFYKEIAGQSGEEKPLTFFERLGHTAALSSKAGGFSGAPTATPKQAAKVATEVGTLAGVEAAFAPLYGIAAASNIAPKVLTALTRLTQAGTSGAAVATTGKLVDTGELPTKEELVKDGLQWVAVDALMQAAHLGGSFAKSVDSIAKQEGIPKKQVLSRLWDATKNWSKSIWGRNIKSPEDIKVQDARMLANQAERAAEEGIETIDMTPEKPLFKALVPEHKLLEKIEAPLQASRQQALKEADKLKPDEIPPPEPAPSPPAHNEVQLQNNVGSVVSQHRIPNANIASRSVRDTINRQSGAAYANVRNLYQESRRENERVIDVRPQMVHQLEQLVEEISQAEVPSSVQRDIRNTARRYIDIASGEGGSLRPVSNSKLIAQIESNNQKVNHDFMQGRPANAYIRLNQILGDAVSEAAASSPNATRAWDAARNAYRDWAQTYGSNEVLPWRDPAQQAHAKLLKSIENADSLVALQPILTQTPRGQALYNSIRRDFAEKKMRPYIKNPTKIRSVDYFETLRDLSPLLSTDEKYAIDEMLERAAGQQERYETEVMNYKQAVQDHKDLMRRQKEALTQWKQAVSDINKRVPYTSDSAILRDLESVRGLQRIEGALEGAVRDAEERKELLEFIKDYSAVNLLTNGEIRPSGKSIPLKKIFNDVNKRALLEHTLGEERTKDLAEIVYNAPQIDKRVSRWIKAARLAKTGGKIIPGVRGNVATGEALVDIWRMFRPAVEKGNYDTVDIELIRKIIENKDGLLNDEPSESGSTKATPSS